MNNCPLCIGLVHREDLVNMLGQALGEKYSQAQVLLYRNNFKKFMGSGDYQYLIDYNMYDDKKEYMH